MVNRKWLWFPATALILSLIVACAGQPAAPPTAQPAPKATTQPAPQSAAQPTAQPAAQAAPQDILKITYASYASGTIPATQADVAFLKDLESRSGGSIKLDREVHGGALLNASQMLEGVGKGQADAGYICTSYAPARLPLSTLTELPYSGVAAGADALARTNMYENYEPFRKEIEGNNVVPLYFHPGVPTILGLAKPITNLSELKGKKLRAYGPFNDIVEKLGITPVAVAGPDIYTGLQTGLIDGYIGFPLWTLEAMKMQEVTKLLMDPGIGTYYDCFMGMNKDKFDKLSQKNKDLVKQMRTEGIDTQLKKLMEGDDQTIAAFRKAGQTLRRFTAQEKQGWRDTAQPEQLWDKWVKDAAAKGLPAQEFMTKYTTLVKENASKSIYKDPFEKW